ncbi:hypothetical protein TWF718_008245 [Orbilia javanica]|uniref:PA14 domain-containing protein n=1 Tax=Orbilia javanica TaxID=47235 RepID=A0AAN8MWJ2_9PEZI
MRVVYWAAVTALGFATSSLAAAVDRRAANYGYDDDVILTPDKSDKGGKGGRGGRGHHTVTVTSYVKVGGKLGYSTRTGDKTDTVYIYTTTRRGGKPAEVEEDENGETVTVTNTKTRDPKPTVTVTSYVTGGKLGPSTRAGDKTVTVFIVTTKEAKPKPTVFITTYVTGGKLGPSTKTGDKTVTVFVVTTKKTKPITTVTETEEEEGEQEEEDEDGETVTVTNTKTKPKVTVTATSYVTPGASLGLTTQTGDKTDTVFIVTTSKSKQTATVTKTEGGEDDEDDATVTVTDTKTKPKVTVTATSYVTSGASLGLTTQTGDRTDTVFIVTTSKAAEPSSKPDTSCGNAGLEVAMFNNPFLNQQEVPNKGFNVNYFTTAIPYQDTTATSIGWNGALSATKYSHLYRPDPPHGLTAKQRHMDGPTFALIYRGYFYAPKTQEYTFYTYDVDDKFYYWLGDNVFDWSEANHNYRDYRVRVRIEGGTYYPIRILYGNGGGGGEFHFDIIGADGVNYVKATTHSDYLISRSCDGEAKRFPSWKTSEYGSGIAGAKRPDISCGNVAGLLFVAFENLWGNQHSSNRIPGFNPDYYKTCKKAFAQGTTRTIGYKDTAGLNPYKMWAPQNVPSVPLLVMHRGFFYVPRDGHYTFHIAGIKDGGWMWLGQKAYTAWSSSNYDCRYLLKTGLGGYNEDASTVELTGGTYFPFRIMLADGGGGGTFNIEIFDNQGNFYVNKLTPTDFLVHTPCDKSAAFTRDWGREAD